MRRDLAGNRYRSDHSYAMARARLTGPASRERTADIAVLAWNIVPDAVAAHGIPVHGVSDDEVRCAEGFDGPGNLRALESEVIRMPVFSQHSILGPGPISHPVRQPPQGQGGSDASLGMVLTGPHALKDLVEQTEMRILHAPLIRLKWNKSRAAAGLGLSRAGLRAKIERYAIAETGKAHQREEG